MTGNFLPHRVLLGALAVCTIGIAPEPAHAQYPLPGGRARSVYRHCAVGEGRTVVKTRIGGGLGPYGYAAISQGFQVAGATLPILLGGPATGQNDGQASGTNETDKEQDPTDTANRDSLFRAMGLTRSSLDDYAKAQKDATAALTRTEKLLAHQPGTANDPVADIERSAQLYRANAKEVEANRDEVVKRLAAVRARMEKDRQALDRSAGLLSLPPQMGDPPPVAGDAKER